MIPDPIIIKFESKLNENINIISSLYQSIIDNQNEYQSNEQSSPFLLDTIQDINDNLTMNLSMIIESHDDFSNINLLNIESEKVSVYKIKDHKSCEIINQEMIKIQKRHIDSSLVSFESSSKKCDEYLLEKIHIYLKTVENSINSLTTKLQVYRNQVNYVDDSYELIDSSIKAKYDQMKNNYSLIMNKMFHESNSQWLSLMSVQDSQLKWYMDNLNNIISNYQNNTDLYNKKQLLFNNADHCFQQICDKTFIKLASSNIYEEAEKYLDKINNVKKEVLEWKAEIILTYEKDINLAEVGLDSFYMSSLEEIHLELYNMQNSLSKLVTYRQKLDHLIQLANSRESLITYNQNHYNELSSDEIDNNYNNTISNTISNTINTNNNDNNTTTINQLTKQNLDDFQSVSHVLMGTRIKSLAQTCDLSPEYTKDILEYLLC